MRTAEDSWLSERLGRQVLSVLDWDERDRPPSLATRSRGTGPVMYQARVDSARIELVHALSHAGLQVVCAGLRMSARLGGRAAVEAPDGIEMGRADPERDAGVRELAAHSFRYDRFHADPQIPTAVANGIKRDWADSYLRGERGEELLVASEDRAPVGFLALAAGDRGRLGVIELLAVAEDARGRGVGPALVAHAAGRWERLAAGTQTTNLEAVRLYARLGFDIEHSWYDLHGHFGT